MDHPQPGCAHPRSLFHAPTRYALQALIRLPDDGSYRLARNLAKDLDLPGPFLAKILQDLGHHGILESHRGPGGGFRLSRRPEHITLREIVVAMEGPDPFVDCLLGHSDGGGKCQCPLRPAWDEVQHLLTTRLAATSLRDLQAASGGPDLTGGAGLTLIAPI